MQVTGRRDDWQVIRDVHSAELRHDTTGTNQKSSAEETAIIILHVIAAVIRKKH